MSFLILAVDTTGEFGSVALSDGAQVLEEAPLHSPEGFGHVLFDEIQALLNRRGTSLAELGGFASAAGPGSFTGVRVGLTAVKGLAEATGRRVVAVSNLAALAWFGTKRLRAVVMDARRGEVYGAVYDSELRLVRDEVVMKFGDWIATLPEFDLELIAQGFVPPSSKFPVTQAPRALAGAIASIAATQFAAGLAKDPAEIDANYVRRSDAELLWRDPSLSPRAQGFALQPHLVGDLVELRPLRPEDWESLYAVASDPLIWELHPARDRYKEEVFKNFFDEGLASGGALIAIDRKTQKVIGSSRYFGHDPARSEIEIGWTFLARSYWGGEYNGEMKRLMLGHAFKFVDSVVFRIGLTNLRSQRAIQKVGGVLTDRREQLSLHGTLIEHAVYQIKKTAQARALPGQNS